MAVVGALSLVKVCQSYWLVNARRRPVDWWRIRVIKVIERGLCLHNTHTGGDESQKMRPVWVKRGLYWRITRLWARGEYIMRLDWLNKYRFFTAHGRGSVRTPTYTCAPLGLTSLCSECSLIYLNKLSQMASTQKRKADDGPLSPTIQKEQERR
jgi:hypothetical protein